MKYGIGILAALGFCLATSMASAQPGPDQQKGPRHRGQGQGRPGSPPNREEIIKRFDADGDGELSAEEKQKAHEAMKQRRGQGQRGGGPDAQGHQGGDRMMELFKRCDADSDGKLDPEEFKQAVQTIMRHVAQRSQGQRGPGGQGFGGRGPGQRGPGGPGPRPDFDRPQRGPRDFDRPGYGRPGPDRPRPDRPRPDRPHRPNGDRPEHAPID